MKRSVSYYKNRFNNLKGRKKLLTHKWEQINKYVRNGGALFTEFNDEGASDRIYDSVAPDAARKLASVLMGLMWPSGRKAMKLDPVEGLAESDENKKFYERSTGVVADIFDNPLGGWTSSLEQHFVDQGTFGTSGIFSAEDEEVDVRFSLWGIKNICVDEGKNGMITTVYYEDSLTAKRIVETYGYDKVSDEIKEAYDNEESIGNKFTIVQAIEPIYKKGDDGVKYMAFESVEFELDGEHIIQTGEFNEMPVPISRFYKDSDNVYGKSPAWLGLPAIVELNTKVSHREMIEKQEIEPALGYDINAFGGDEFDTTPGAVNEFDMTMSGGRNPVFRMIPQINVNITDKGIERLEEKVAQAFGLDRLLDFNSSQQMTATESVLRADIRGQALNATFARQDSEIFTPTIQRVVAIAFRKGKFGVIPGSKEEQKLRKENEIRENQGLPPKEVYIIPQQIAELIKRGEDFYKITYVSPASAMRDSESLRALINAVQQTASLAQVLPGILDNIDPDLIARKIWDLNRADKTVLRAKEFVDQQRQVQAQAQAQQAQQLQQSNELTLQKQAQEVQSAEQE